MKCYSTMQIYTKHLLHTKTSIHFMSIIFTKEMRHKNEYGIYKCVHSLK